MDTVRAGIDVDVAVIGAGAVGLACAYALTKAGRDVVVIEREMRIGAGISARNSEVIHAGLHYPTGSFKARFCVTGRRALYEFLSAHHVAFERCGKLIVATENAEIPALERLYAQGAANGVEGLSWLSGAEARALEPQLKAVAAIQSAESGVLDAHGYMLALQGEIEARGGAIALNAPFLGAAREGDAFRLRIGGESPSDILARHLVIAAGLGAQGCTRAIEGFPAASIPMLHFGKGSYFTLVGAPAPFQRLIYPPPITGALGIHYRRDLGGVARFGPDLEFVETEDYRVDPAKTAAFETYVRRFWPGLPHHTLAPDYAGVRPKLHGPGEAQGDFIIDSATIPGLVVLFGIESPGLTSSLAIGAEVAMRLARAP